MTCSGTLRMPKGAIFAGVYSGLRLPIYHERYADNRAASLIGKFLIEQILRASGETGDPTGGYLANISPSEYVRRFRNELPVKLRGRISWPISASRRSLEVVVRPDEIYKVRSRTEHHIYENDRTHRFMERLARARRTGELRRPGRGRRADVRLALELRPALRHGQHRDRRAGQLHPRARPGTRAVRRQGHRRRLRRNGGGADGRHARGPRGPGRGLCRLRCQKTGKQPMLILGSSPGAMSFGHRCIN